VRLAVEQLEDRLLLSASNPAGIVMQTFHTVSPNFSSSQSPSGFWPSQIRHGYGFDKLTYDGSGQTIAIVDAYHDPNLASDLATFDTQFSLPGTNTSSAGTPGSVYSFFTQVDQNGNPVTNVGTDSTGGWELEEALDVEWAHAIAPQANILLVEANSANLSDLLTGVSTAASSKGVVAVSMSWGSNEFLGEGLYDSFFTTPANHPGVTFLAASGDAGAPAGWPAISSNVVAVGGTTLTLDSTDNRTKETAWNGSGGGPSSFLSEPGFQSTYSQSSYVQNTLGNTVLLNSVRSNPDVAYAADPSPGFAVYDTFPYSGVSFGWLSVGGTSAGTPQWAALMALVAQGRGSAGSLDGATQTLPSLYKLAGSAGSYPSDFYDITSGSNGYSAQAGYDLATGLGSPHADQLIADLINGGKASATFAVSTSPSNPVAGATFNLVVTAQDGSGNTNTGYTGTVHLTSTDATATFADAATGQPLVGNNYTFTTQDQGAHNFTVILTTAGSQTLSAKDSTSGATGSTSVTVSPAAPSKLVFGQQPTNTAIGAPISPAVTVRLFDQFGNLATNDNTDQVSMTIGTNPGGGTLSGTNPVTVKAGVATFSNLSINQAGTGYTLVAGLGQLAVTSNSFNVTSTQTIEDFEKGSAALNPYFYAGSYPPPQLYVMGAPVAHDGNFGLAEINGNAWIYRNDAPAQVKQGETISAWVQLYNSADGRAYFGFGASSRGTLSVVLAPNTHQFLLQNNNGYGFIDIGAAPQPVGGYRPNHWYRVEVAWAVGGSITGRLYDSDGKTLIDTVQATTNVITSGGIAFRAFGNAKFWDSVVMTPGTGSASSAAVTGRSITNTDGDAGLNTAGGSLDNIPIESVVPDQSHRTTVLATDVSAVQSSLVLTRQTITIATAEASTSNNSFAAVPTFASAAAHQTPFGSQTFGHAGGSTIVEDDSKDEPGQPIVPAPSSNPQTNPELAPRLPAEDIPLEQTASPALPPQAFDDFFAEGQWGTSPSRVDTPLQAPLAGPEQPAEPLAIAAAFALVLGAYWTPYSNRSRGFVRRRYWDR
jgi:hypothetical protein